RELELYSPELAKIPQTVALNKIDVASDRDLIDSVETALKAGGHRVFRISAATHKGLKQLLYYLWDRLDANRAAAPLASGEDIVNIKAPKEEDRRLWEAREQQPGEWTISGKGFERLVAMTNLDNDFALRRFQRSLEKAGVNRKLKEMGAKEGDTV